MLDLSSFQSVEDNLKTPEITQSKPTDIVDLSGLAPVSEPTMGDKVVTAAARVKESVGSLYDKVTGQEGQERVNIIPNRVEADIIKRQEMAKAKHLENLNTNMSYYLDAVKLGDPDALKLDPGTVAIQSAKRQTAEQGLDTSFIDPLMWPLENAVASGALKGLASVYDSVKMNKSVRTFMERLKPNEAEEMTNTIKFMEEHGINPTDALVQGSKGSDLGQFIGGHNVFGVRDAFNSSETLANDYFKMVLNVTDKIKANGVNIGDIKTWKDITKAQKEVKEGVEHLRKTYKDREAAAYGEVSKLVKSLPDEYEVGAFHTDVIKQLADEGVPPEAVDVVKNIFNRFAKPYADETKELAALKKNRISLQTEAKSLSMKQNEALKAGDTLEANRLEQAIDDNAQALKDLAGKEQELKDVRYMNTEELMSSIKLINRRLYKPGGAISLKDADELRGLQIAKSRMEEFLESKLPDGELKQKIRDAKDITIARTTLFGAKDMGGEKALLANILNQGDFTKIGKYLTGPEAKENIVFIRDTFGKDSEVYKTSLGHYLTDKLGMTPEGLTQLLDTKKVFGISDRVNLQQAAAKISTLDAQDFSLVRQVAGKDAALDLKSIQRLTQNFADLENAAEKYGRGITAGKLAYVEGDANILGMAGRGLKLVKDAVMYHSAKTAEKIIYNQPKFRTITGALTGETIYLANNEDKDLTIEGILGSLVGGGVGGYYGGRATRSLLENDINKITRYLKSGAEFGENMPKGLIDSLTRLGAQARQFEGEAMDIASETAQKADLRPVGAAAANMGNRVQQSLGLPPSNPNIIQDAGMAGKSWGDEAVEAGSKTSVPAGLEETNSLTVGNAPKKKMPIEEGYDNLEDFINQNDDVYEAVIDYTGDSFKKINLNYLKGKPDETLEKLFAMEGDYYGKAYRGTHLDTKKLMELQEGDLIENKMPLSSSSDDFGPELYIENKKSSRKNVSKAVLEIDTKYVPQYDISKFAQFDEGEVLISPRTLLQVEEIDKSGPIVKVKLNAVHNDIQDIIAKHKGRAIKDLMSLTGGAILTKEAFGTKAEASDVESKGKTTETQGNGIEDALAAASSKANILKDLPIKKVETYDKATEVFYRNKDAKGLAEYLNKIPDESYRQWFRFMSGIPEGTKITEASIKAARK